MEDNVLISIIVPIYNAADYLCSCLDSILKYGKNIEVICINDGSTDNSEKICTYFEKKDKRVKVINQANAGVSVARNVGIENSHGRWIMFVDADDYLCEGYYDAIDSCDNELDIAFFAANCEDKISKTKLPIEHTFTANDRAYLINNMIKSLSILENSACSLRSPWSKAYRREFINDHNIRFPRGVIIGEDYIFNIYAYSKAQKMRYYPIPIYNVVECEDSATHRFVGDMIERENVFQTEFKKALLFNGILNNVYDEYLNEQKSGIIRCLRKQIYRGNYSRIERRQLIDQVLNSECFKEAINSPDSNRKRALIIHLMKIKSILLLRIIFKYTDKAS